MGDAFAWAANADGADDDIADNIWDLINGSPFCVNAQGEAAEGKREHYAILVDDLPEFDDTTEAWTTQVTDGVATVTGLNGMKAMDKQAAVQCMTFQLLYMKDLQNEKIDALNGKQIIELVYLRMLYYRLRLLTSGMTAENCRCKYVEVETCAIGANPARAWTTAANDGFRKAKNTVRQLLDRHKDHLGYVRRQCTNMLCLVAYMFRSQGHHYLADYQSKYESLWSKWAEADKKFANTWATLATIGCHCIPPYRLDNFWLGAVAEGATAAALSLRVTVPAAGTAAVFTMHAGWIDLVNVYGGCFGQQKELADELEAIYRDLRLPQNRWKFGINAALYGEQSNRLNLEAFAPLAAAVLGAYQELVERSTLVQSASLVREAGNAPLITDLSGSLAQVYKNQVLRQAEKSTTSGGTVASRLAIKAPKK